MQCPICGSPNAKTEERRKASFFGSLFGANAPSPRVHCSCSNCKQLWSVDERDGTIWEADKAHVNQAREEWQRRGFVGPDIVCNGHSDGTTAEVYGFNEKSASWLKTNLRTGRWMLEGQCIIVPIEEVYRIVGEAPKAGLVVKTNHVQRHLAKPENYSEQDKAELHRMYASAATLSPRQQALAEELKRSLGETLQGAIQSGLLGERAYSAVGDGLASSSGQPAKLKSPIAILELTNVVAQGISETFSESLFTELFREQPLAKGWSLGNALAGWYSLGHLCLVVAAWTAYNDAGKVRAILDLCRQDFTKYWKLSDEMLEVLRTIVNETEAEAIASFAACKSGTDLFNFFNRYVSRILGSPVPFSNREPFEDQLMGIKYMGSDPILCVAVCSLFINECAGVCKLLRAAPL